MLTYPNAKINLGLNIIEKRVDQYHNIESVFFPIPLKDILEIVEHSKDENVFSASGINIPSDGKKNLVLRAYELLQKQYDLPYVQVHLHKQIPIGAGLGGGSADAAFLIKLVNKVFNLAMSKEVQENFATKIGADCPFFIHNQTAFIEGIGERITPIDIDLSAYFLVLHNPGIHVSTAEAYANIQAKKWEIPLLASIQSEVATWKYHLKNDFEASISEKYPQIGKCKTDFYTHGAVYAAMTGSGSSVYALYCKVPFKYLDNPDYWVFNLSEESSI